MVLVNSPGSASGHIKHKLEMSDPPRTSMWGLVAESVVTLRQNLNLPHPVWTRYLSNTEGVVHDVTTETAGREFNPLLPE